MFSQAELESFLAICIVLICLGAAIDIYWILNGWPTGKAQDTQTDTTHQSFAARVLNREKDHRVESYVQELRELAKDK